MYSATLHLPGSPDPAALEDLFEVQTQQTCAWYLDEWRHGRKPHCCCKCAGVRYDPKSRGSSPVFRSVDEVFRTKSASCEEAAYIDTGARRAEAIRDRSATPDSAQALWYVELIDRGPRRWHAIMQTPQGAVDVAKTLQRAGCPCPEQR